MQPNLLLAAGFHLGHRALTVNTFGEDSPGDLLRDAGLGDLLSQRPSRKSPGVLIAMQEPARAAITRNVKLRHAAGRSRNPAVCEGKRSHEGVEHRIVKLARHNAGFVHCLPDLLL